MHNVRKPRKLIRDSRFEIRDSRFKNSIFNILIDQSNHVLTYLLPTKKMYFSISSSIITCVNDIHK